MQKKLCRDSVPRRCTGAGGKTAENDGVMPLRLAPLVPPRERGRGSGGGICKDAIHDPFSCLNGSGDAFRRFCLFTPGPSPVEGRGEKFACPFPRRCQRQNLLPHIAARIAQRRRRQARPQDLIGGRRAWQRAHDRADDDPFERPQHLPQIKPRPRLQAGRFAHQAAVNAGFKAPGVAVPTDRQGGVAQLQEAEVHDNAEPDEHASKQKVPLGHRQLLHRFARQELAVGPDPISVGIDTKLRRCIV